MSEQLLHPSTVSVYKKTYIWQGILNTFRTRAKHLENCWLWAVWHTCFIALKLVASVDRVGLGGESWSIAWFCTHVSSFVYSIFTSWSFKSEEKGTILSLIAISGRDCLFDGKFARYEDVFQFYHLQQGSPQDFVHSQASLRWLNSSS